MQLANVSRRDVLGMAVVAFGQQVGLAAPPGSPSVRFGVRAPLPQVSLRERALLAKKIGFDGIELGPEWLKEPLASIQEQLQGTGVAVSAIVGSLGLLDTDPEKRAAAVELDRRRLQMAQELRADFLIEVPIFGPNRFQDLSPVMTPREIEERLLIAGLKQLIPDMKRTGVTVLLEPLTQKETHFMNLQSQGAAVIKAIGEPTIKLLSDFYHMQMEEQDIGQTLSRYGNHTAYVHLADGEKRTEPGSLPFDYRPGFRALKKWKFAGWLTMESKATDTADAALERGLRYIKNQWETA